VIHWAAIGGREELERLFEDTTLLSSAFAIALGWSLYELARGVATPLSGSW
jgi:hypothetical protein